MRTSAGILLHRKRAGRTQVLLVHPGGPWWARKDAGAWSVPKGEHDEDDDALEAALRELAEELGAALEGVELGPPVPLGEVKQKGGKLVRAWAVRGDLAPAAVVSNTFEMEWPPHSGRTQTFPEIDRAEWFDLDVAREKINEAQRPFLERLVEVVGAD